MKKLALIIVLTIIGLTSFAQLTILHTFNDYMYYSSADDTYNNMIINENKYITAYTQEENGTIKYYIYNADFSLDNLQTITPNNLPEGYSLYSTYCKFLSNNLINTDDYYEWLIVGYNSAAQINEGYYSYIVNSQGDIIYDFGYSSTTSFSFHVANEQLRAMRLTTVYDENNNWHYSTEIYSCGGSVTRIAESKGKNSTNAYPNPATSFINLPYELNNDETSTMNIYDINGRLIEQKPIGYHFRNLELNVSNYKAGTYIYEYNGESYRFVVQ